MVKPLFYTICETCESKLGIHNVQLLGKIVECPKCHAMVLVSKPGDSQPVSESGSRTVLSEKEDEGKDVTDKELKEEPVTLKEEKALTEEVLPDESESAVSLKPPSIPAVENVFSGLVPPVVTSHLEEPRSGVPDSSFSEELPLKTLPGMEQSSRENLDLPPQRMPDLSADTVSLLNPPEAPPVIRESHELHSDVPVRCLNINIGEDSALPISDVKEPELPRLEEELALASPLKSYPPVQNVPPVVSETVKFDISDPGAEDVSIYGMILRASVVGGCVFLCVVFFSLLLSPGFSCRHKETAEVPPIIQPESIRAHNSEKQGETEVPHKKKAILKDEKSVLVDPESDITQPNTGDLSGNSTSAEITSEKEPDTAENTPVEAVPGDVIESSEKNNNNTEPIQLDSAKPKETVITGRKQEETEDLFLEESLNGSLPERGLEIPDINFSEDGTQLFKEVVDKIPSESSEIEKKQDKDGFSEELSEKLTMNLKEITIKNRPVSAVIRFISQLTGIKIHADWDMLRNEGIKPDSMITLKEESVSVRDILDKTLGSVGLEYVQEKECDLKIVPSKNKNEKSPVQEPIKTESLNVANLICAGSSIRDMSKLLTTFVSPETWKENGGEGSVQAETSSRIKVRNYPAVIREVEYFLQQLRLARNILSDDNVTVRREQENVTLMRRVELVREVREHPVNCDFSEGIFLKTALETLAKQAEARLIIREDIIKDDAHRHGSRNPLETRIKERYELVSFREAVVPLMQEFGLVAYPSGHNTFTVTTPEDARSDMQLEFYPISDIINRQISPVVLMKTIRSKVHPETWDIKTGTGKMYYDVNSQFLIVLQNPEVHAALNTWFIYMRNQQKKIEGGNLGEE